MNGNGRYVLVKFKAEDTRTYTYLAGDIAMAINDEIMVPAGKGGGEKRVVVAGFTDEEPKFECKAVISLAPAREAEPAKPVSDIDKLRASGAVETVGDLLNPRAVAGDNAPPEEAPIDGHRLNIDSIYDEAKNWLDGTPIANQAQADEVTRLLDMAKKAGKAADTQRDVEKRPHLEAGRAVDAAWKPLTTLADKVVKGAQGALAGWLVKERNRLAAEATEARRIADEEAERAWEISRAAADSGNIAAIEEAESAVQMASDLASDAKRAEKAKPIAKVEGMARGAGLRTVYDVALSDDPNAATMLSRWCWAIDKQRVTKFCLEMAREAVRLGGREIPGCTVTAREVVR